LIERLKKLNPVIASHPSFAYFSGDRYLATVSKDTVPWLYRIGTIVKQGLIVAGASDSPIVPNSPLMGMYGGITRKTSSGQLLGKEESLSASHVLAMYTLNAAYASHEESIKGTIAPGKLADFVLLSGNPTLVPAEAIKNIIVLMTVIGGKVVYRLS
jgi:predicted amidohydrolase YtcJ